MKKKKVQRAKQSMARRQTSQSQHQGVVINGAIDGNSRLTVYLKCATNNRAETVLDNLDTFNSAINKYGVPS